MLADCGAGGWYVGGMTWPPDSLADILDVGPSPADPPEDDEDWALLDELASCRARHIGRVSGIDLIRLVSTSQSQRNWGLGLVLVRARVRQAAL